MSATLAEVRSPTRTVAWSRLGDEMLAGRAASGNDGAFTALYERYYGPLLGYTRSILLDDEDARDATQNALENALRALPRRDSSLPLRPWLYKIAHNEAINIMRRRRPQDELTSAFEPTVPGPEVDAEQRGRLAQLVDDLRTLPERQRGALVMRELSGLSYDEIGSALGVTNEAARRAVFDARSALHAAVDGRATACVSVRHCISDGDRRSLRARSIRAHLRSCDDCASFQRSIGARKADLLILAPWASGAAVMGALGFGGAGGGALLAGGGASAAAGGGGISWGGLPLAAKGVAVAAALATTGTAAVEIKKVAEPERRTAQSQTAQPRSPKADALAQRAAKLAAAAAERARARTSTGSSSSATTGNRLHTSSGTQRSSSVAAIIATPNVTTPDLAPPAAAQPKPAPAAQPKEQTAATPSAPTQTPEQKAARKLNPLLDAVRQAFADAQAIAAGGTQASLALATSMLDRTLGPLRISINKVLSPIGMSLPSYSPTAPATTTGGILAPVQQVLGSVTNLLQQLLGKR
jgi:RNA polymerase sigma factor (sigma-70 family)